MSAMIRIFSWGERWNVPFNEATTELNGTLHLSRNDNILTIARKNIHYLFYIIPKQTNRFVWEAFWEMRFIENTKSAIVLYVLFHCTRRECNGTCSIALLGNVIFYSISRDHKQPFKRSEFNKVLYKITYIIRNAQLLNLSYYNT
jgi:hypothetical protein